MTTNPAIPYILSNKRRNALYIGSTDDLKKRVYFHKKLLILGFTKKYNADQLVWFEKLATANEAVGRENKNLLIWNMNPKWKDLYEVSLR